MIDEEITEIQELEAQHCGLTRRIARLVDAAQRGENDGSEIAALTRRVASLSGQIEAAKAERERTERARHREEQDQAKRDLVVTRAECLKQRDLFLSSYRSACIALGSYLDLRSQACELTTKTASGFGVLPPEMNALRALEFSEPPVDSVRAGLIPKIDVDLKLSFPITPMYDKFTR